MSAIGKVDRPDRLVVPTDAARRIVALADQVGDLEKIHARLRGLTALGHTVVLIWREGEPGKRLRSFKARRQLQPVGMHTPRALLRQVADSSRSPRRWWSERGTLLGAVHQDPRALRLLAKADALILVGDEARELEEHLVGADLPLVPADELRWYRDVWETWTWVEELVDDGVEVTEELVRGLLERVDLLGGRVPDEHQWLLVPLVEGLHQQGRFALAQQLADHLAPDRAATAEEQAMRAGLMALVATSAAGQEADGLRPAATALISCADEAVANGRIDDAADLVTLALELLFHRELHADQLSSPLVEDPDDFLAAWRGSRVGQLLATTPADPGPAGARAAQQAADTEEARSGSTGAEHASRSPRVVVSPGTFPQFAPPVVEALSERADVEVVELSARASLRWLGVSRLMVNKRLRQALGRPRTPDLELISQLESADAAFLDWGDRGALELVLSAPPGLPVTLRVHSMDALSAWVHLLDWSRVGDLVVVSEHMRQLMHHLLGDRLADTRVHVVPNVVDAERFGTQKAPGHRRRLLMIGWGQTVKEPLWALEVLARLREHDPDWELTFLGADLLRGKYVSADRYADEFVERLVRDDVREAVDFVPWTDDIAPHLERAGFVLSLSRRESFGLGMMEAAGSGVVPVVRDWPIFASLGGAHSVVPTDWVIDSIEGAVQRILAHAEEPAWSEASARARAEVRERYASDTTLQTLCDVILGVGAPTSAARDAGQHPGRSGGVLDG
ncbi:glycosyltransferase family 4 protein [Ornithinimicrobium sp. Y1847]|uniref:glycosyltransferase family 4 protein n=1 Tax=unclassified Ornithinimicrobium TaxID=2615080 RepID=UPI003B67E1B0